MAAIVGVSCKWYKDVLSVSVSPASSAYRDIGVVQQRGSIRIIRVTHELQSRAIAIDPRIDPFLFRDGMQPLHPLQLAAHGKDPDGGTDANTIAVRVVRIFGDGRKNHPTVSSGTRR